MKEYSEGQPEWWADGNVWDTVGKKARGEREKNPRDFLPRESLSGNMTAVFKYLKHCQERGRAWNYSLSLSRAESGLTCDLEKHSSWLIVRKTLVVVAFIQQRDYPTWDLNSLSSFWNNMW